MKRFVQIIFGFITAIFIICIATVITLNCRPLYEADIKNYNIEETTGLSHDEIISNYQAMIDYNNLGGPSELKFPTFTMSEGGRIHFEEVKRIFTAMEYAAIICGIATVIFIIVSSRKKLIGYYLWSGMITILLPVIAGIYALAAWDSLFVTFHRLLFNNDYWIFDEATDPVITILPDGYFLHCLVMIIIIAFALAAICFVRYFLLKRKLKAVKA